MVRCHYVFTFSSSHYLIHLTTGWRCTYVSKTKQQVEQNIPLIQVCNTSSMRWFQSLRDIFSRTTIREEKVAALKHYH